MAQMTGQLDFDKIFAAIKQLPKSQKVQIWQSLDAELNRDEINREFARALEEIWAANAHFSEAEVNADIKTAIREARAETTARRS
jgi:hypothetical protein